jgi:hypothetical protein
VSLNGTATAGNVVVASPGIRLRNLIVSGKKATIKVSVMPPVINPGNVYYIDYAGGDDSNSRISMDLP